MAAAPPPRDGQGGALARRRLAAFVAWLRRHGHPVGPAEAADALRLMAALDLSRPAVLRAALKPLLCGRREEWEHFDALFDAHWLGRGARTAVRVSGTPPPLPSRPTVPAADGGLKRLMDAADRRAAAAGVAGFATVHQVHGDRLVEGAPGLPPRTEADAIVSAPGGLAPAVKTADCVPVLLCDRRTGRVAAVHAGWRGTRLRIVARAVEALAGGPPAGRKDETGDLGPVLAAIGPCIGSCCYEVSAELAAEFAAAFGPGVVAGRKLDLVEANRRALVEAGVRPEAIDVVGGCTSCHPDRFFSHRRDAGRTGRHLSWISPLP